MARRAFTLIELLVVILIIALLIGLSVMVGRTVVGGGKVSQTQDVIRALDVVLNDVISRDGIPKPYVEDPHNPGVYMPIIDGRNMAVEEMNTENRGYQMINSIGLFLLQLRESNSSMEAIEGLDAELRRLYTPYSENNAEADNVVHEIPTIFDAWGNPIRYVHPSWDARFWGDDLDNLMISDAAQASEIAMVSDALNVVLPQGGEWAIDRVRRNMVPTTGGNPADSMPDSDGGVSPNQRPYFYSAGPDGKVGFDDADGDGEKDPDETDYNEDNVYTTMPVFRD